MHLLKKGILARLGLTDAALARARSSDPVLDELCRDLEKVAFAAGASPDDTEAPVTSPDQDLLRLMGELEAEIRERIDGSKAFGAGTDPIKSGDAS